MIQSRKVIRSAVASINGMAADVHLLDDGTFIIIGRDGTPDSLIPKLGDMGVAYLKRKTKP